MSVEEKQKPQFSPKALALVKKYIAKFPEGKQKSAILATLHLAQAELGGWLSVEVMDYVAELLDLKPIEVYEVASFYSQFYLKPVGKYVIEVCHTGPCSLRGADELIAYFEKKLGIKKGETTPDGMFTLKGVECLAACGSAPVFQCGMHYYENMTEEKVDAFLEQCRKENKVSRPYPIMNIEN
jgi:NADH-quinone oxidoreductase subunit E